MPPGLKPVLGRLAAGKTLAEAEAEEAFGVIMSGEATPSQIAGLLMAMRVRGETVAELTGAVRAMRARMIAIEAPPDAMDVCGTGGDAAGTLNVSTAVTFVVAGAGVPVAKHGNRALSSRTGGADVLAALDVPIEPPFERLAPILRAAGCVFLFAPRHHAALRHAAGPRAELGTRTIFNLLGPLANPARVRRQLTGVFAPVWARPMAETLARLGTEQAWIVHGQGLDELTLAGENQVVELSPQGIPGIHPRSRGGRPRSSPDRRHKRRGCGGERRRPPCPAEGRAWRLSRHRPPQRRGRARRRGPRPLGRRGRGPGGGRHRSGRGARGARGLAARKPGGRMTSARESP